MQTYVNKLSKDGYAIAWLIFLYISPYATNKLDRERGGTKSDFEDWLILKIPNMNFRKWCGDMVSKGLMIPAGNKLIKGTEHEVYLFNKKNIIKMIGENELFQLFIRFYLDHYMGYDVFYNPPKINEIRKLLKERSNTK